jgi:FimV-like protein
MTKAHRPIPRFFQRSALWAALSLSIFGSAQALTLNRPVVQSKQGEALRVEIDINEISATELTDFQASLANTETYIATRAEVPLSNGSPMEIQVQLLRRDNGRPYLKVTSKQPVSGNSMDLLLDLRWATGRMLRDISLSIDENKAAAKPIRTPALLGSQQKGNGQQLEVQRGDTAGQLAAESMPSGVSLDQMLLALLRNNPDAFVDDNVNRLKAGALLTLPTEQEARAVSRDDARKQIQIQTKDFEAYRSELAARAPGGTIPKATRNSVGRLEARIENKNAKPNQDKLTLSKPSKHGAEEKIAKQREAQEAAKRAEELSRNIEDLAKIAAATAVRASEPASGELAVAPPASNSAQANADAWLDELTQNPLAPVGAGSLIALLVLIGLWRRHANKKSQDGQDIQGLPPLNVKFDLELPTFEEPTVEKQAHADYSNDHSHGHLHDEEDHGHHAGYEAGHSAAAAHAQPAAAARPTMDMPNVSLDLNEASNSPYQVRIDLADELWNLGQLHTSRALMEEVAHEASGADKEKALRWLAERG